MTVVSLRAFRAERFLRSLHPSTLGPAARLLLGDDDDDPPAEEPAHQTTDDNPGILPSPIR